MTTCSKCGSEIEKYIASGTAGYRLCIICYVIYYSQEEEEAPANEY